MPGHRLPSGPDPGATTTEAVKAQIERLPRGERAMLRPWLLARFDVRGYAATAYHPDRANDDDRSNGES
jgi:hypothetical protein